MICWQENGLQVDLFPASVIALRGQHNLLNVLGACAIAAAAGFSPEAMRSGVEGFAGVPHRLEPVATVAGVQYVNDSKGTNVDAVIKALQSYAGSPIVLILGGRDKHGDFTALR